MPSPKYRDTKISINIHTAQKILALELLIVCRFYASNSPLAIRPTEQEALKANNSVVNVYLLALFLQTKIQGSF